MQSHTYPRVVIEGPVPEQERLYWRVVVDRKEDAHGVLKDTRIIELHHERDVDAMGVKQWRKVDGGTKASMADWINVAVAALELALQETK